MTYNMQAENEKNHYKDMLLAVLPLVLCGTIMYGPRVLLLCTVAMLTAKATDVLVSMIRHQDFDKNDHSSTFSAIVFTMLLPVNVPIYIIIITVGMVTLVGKHLFGGKDVYPFNLTALAMCVASVNWPDKVFSAVTPFTKVDFWSGAAASTAVSNAGIIKQGGVPYVSTFNMLLGNHAGVMGAEFLLVIASVAVFLLVTKRITWHIPVTFLLTCGAIAFFFPRVYGFSRIDSVKFELLNGALIFCAIYMMNEPATTPNNPKAKVIFGVLAGVLAMLFRYYGGYEIGTCFALLLVNTVEGFVDRLVEWKPVIEIKKPIYESEEKIYRAEKTPKSKKEKIENAQDAIDLIGETEDKIDQVIYSTRTLDIAQVLKAEQELKQQQAKKRKGGKK